MDGSLKEKIKKLNPSRALVQLQTISCHHKLPANYNGIKHTH